MTGLEAMQGAEQDRARCEKPGIARSLLDQLGEGSHGTALQILGDVLELVDRLALLALQRADNIFETMIEMIADQRLLGLADSFLDRVKLLSDVDAGAAGLDHLDDAAQVPVGAVETLDDVGMGGVPMCPGHAYCYPPGGDIVKAASRPATGQRCTYSDPNLMPARQAGNACY